MQANKTDKVKKKKENKRGLKLKTLNMKYSFVGWNPLVNAHFSPAGLFFNLETWKKDDLQTKSKFLEFANYHLKPAKKTFF